MAEEKTAHRIQRLQWTPDSVQNMTIFGLFVLLCIIGFIFEPTNFFKRVNITNIFVAASSIIMVAAPITLVLISGNLDLSVGGVGAMGGVIFGLLTHYGMNIPLAMLIAILAGGAAGFLSGISISVFALPSFIISIAFKYIGRGIALIGAEGNAVFGIPKAIDRLSITLFGWLPLPMVYAIVVAVIFMFIQSRTVFGSMCYATGANIKAAKLSGVSDIIAITGVFTMAGIMTSFAGIIVASRVIVADSGIFPTLESDCIIAAVLGGTDINGGRGTVFGMLIGALFVTVLTNIMGMQGIPFFVQNVVKGVVFIAAIFLNDFIRKRVRV